MSDYYEINRLAVVDILEAWGINPHNVATFGVTAEGYFEFQRDAFGHKIIVNEANAPQLKSREWPEGFPVDTLFTHLNAMRSVQP